VAVKEIRHHPDDVLRGKAKKVSLIDASIQKLIDDMIDTMHQANGAGLAAPQIGVPLRVIVLQTPEDEEPLAVINPEIVNAEGEYEVTEGCLSVPGLCGEIIRARKVTAKGLDREGRRIKIKAEGLMAQAIQHELDHLNGTLYIDRVDDQSKLREVEASPPEGGEEA
jgi:peptide deformylase